MALLKLKIRTGLIVSLVMLMGSISAQAQAEDFAGLWTLTIDTPRGVRNPTLEIVQANGSYAGTYNSARGPVAIKQITTEGAHFEFPLLITIPIGEISVNYKGQIAGDEMKGSVQNPRGEVPFTGVRNK